MSTTHPTESDDDLPAEIDFSSGTRGKFTQAGQSLNLPVYLQADVQAYLAARAQAKGVQFSELVNALLQKDIELIEAAK